MSGDEIRATRIVLVDDQGRDRIILDAQAPSLKGYAVVEVINPMSGDRIVLTADDGASDGGADVTWYKAGKYIASIGTVDDGVAEVCQDEGYEPVHSPIAWRSIE